MIFFDPDELLGSQPSAAIAQYLTSIGDDQEAGRYLNAGAGGQSIASWIRGESVPWAATDSVLGFIERDVATDKQTIRPVSEIAADTALQGKQVKITLDRFYVEKYPGSGEHRVLCEFAARNQVVETREDLRFATTLRVRDGQAASVFGLPIFQGITVGPNGLDFEVETVNVANSTDDEVLAVLEGDVFKDGLKLLTDAQPVMKPFVQLARGVVRAAASRNKNKKVHNFSLGLDFSGSATSTRIRQGTYVVVQGNVRNEWRWSDYVMDMNTMRIIPGRDGVENIGLNYMLFGVSLYAP